MQINLSSIHLGISKFSLHYSNGCIADDSFINCLVKEHNRYRRIHGVPELKYNKTVKSPLQPRTNLVSIQKLISFVSNLRQISKFSQEYAESLCKRNCFEHSGNKKYGENLYTSWGTGSYTLNCNKPADDWYSEISTYGNDWKKNPSMDVVKKCGTMKIRVCRR